MAKVRGGVVASNNLKDILPFIEKYNLCYITTAMILKEGLEKGLITEADGNKMWTEMLSKNRLLPASSFTEYLAK